MKHKNEMVVERKHGKGGTHVERMELYRQYCKDLSRGGTRGIGFWTALQLKLAGKRDGTNGLPRLEEGGRWNSAFIDHEYNRYEEFCSRMWAMLQLENEAAYVRLGMMMDQLEKTQSQLAQARDQLSVAHRDELQVGVARQEGEEMLREYQVRSRRSAEKGRRMAPFQNQVKTLEQQRTQLIDDFSELRSNLLESENTIRLICHRMEEDMRQRLDVYWNAVLKHHPDQARMPAAPEVRTSCRAEQAYLALHQRLMQRAELVQTQIKQQEVA